MLLRTIFVLSISIVCLNASILRVPSQYNSIQEAITNSTDGDTVLVSPGQYNENINYEGKQIIVASRFLQEQDTSYIHNTIIHGVGTASVVTFDNGEGAGARLEGLTITSGSTIRGAGIYIGESAEPTLNQLMITDNHASHRGGGIFSRSEFSPQLINLRLINNSADDGGGISLERSDAAITGCWFEGNSATIWGGGGIYMNVSTPIISDCRFLDNFAEAGGAAIYCNFSAASLENVIMYGNQSPGAALYCHDSDPTLSHVTIYGNTGSNVGAIRGYGYSDITVVNSILWGNSPAEIQSTSPGSIDITYSCISGGWQGEGNISSNPDFCDAGSGNFSISGQSPCIGSGAMGAVMGAGGIGCESSGYVDLSRLHVSTTGSDVSGNGTLDMPFASIQRAILWSTAGDTILVQPGVYPENLHFFGRAVLVASQHLFSGDIQDIEATVIDAGLNGRALSFEFGEVESSQISGLLLRSGTADIGAGIYCAPETRPVLTDLIIEGCLATEDGGGMYIDTDSSPIVFDVIFTNNSAVNGGGLFVNHAQPIMEDLTVLNNSAESGKGGGLYVFFSDFELTHGSFNNNQAGDSGAAIFLDNSSPTIEYLTIQNNQSAGSAIACDFSSPLLNHLTIVDNISSTGGGVGLVGASYPRIRNTILWENYPAQIHVEAPALGYVIYSCVQGGWSGAANFSDDPLFCDRESGDLDVANDSPCLESASDGFNIGAGSRGCQDPVDIAPMSMPHDFTLSNNFPNPFNASTQFEYVLPQSAHVSFMLYDIHGRGVETLVQGQRREGVHQVSWNGETSNGKPASAGVYFARLVVGSYSKVVKITLLP